MAIMVPNEGELKLLESMLKNSSDEALILKLYSNNYTPDADAAAGSFTEATFTNYAAKTLARASWSAAYTTGGNAECSYAQQSWTAGSSQNIVGYYLVGASSSKVHWCEKFASSRSLTSTDVLNISPKFQLSSAT